MKLGNMCRVRWMKQRRLEACSPQQWMMNDTYFNSIPFNLNENYVTYIKNNITFIINILFQKFLIQRPLLLHHIYLLKTIIKM